MAPVLNVLQQYHRSISESQARFFHHINELNQLPLSVGHLEETTVTEIINSLRKSCIEIDMAVENLAAKWNTMTLMEEVPKKIKFPSINTRETKSVSSVAVHKRRHRNCYGDSDDLPQPKIAKLHRSQPSTTLTTASSAQTGQTFQAPNLVDICTKVLQNNIDSIEYTGGVPFEYLEEILEHATPSQLLVFEHHNPYLMADSDIFLWQHHVFIHYPTKIRGENESWREMFLRCQMEKEQRFKAVAARKTPLAYVAPMIKANTLRKKY